MNALSTRRAALGALLSLSVISAANAGVINNAYTLLAPSNTTIPNSIVPSGNYSAIVVPSVGMGANSWSALATNSAGQAVIYYQYASTYNKAYFFDPAYSSTNGLVEIDPQVLNASGNDAAAVLGISSSGAVAGTFAKSGSSSQVNAWVYIPGAGGATGATTTLSFTGALASAPYNYPGIATYTQNAIAVGGAGWVVGNATRYGASNTTTTGTDAWIQDPSNLAGGPVIVPQIAGDPGSVTILGTPYTYQKAAAVAVNASGTAIGTEVRYQGQASATSSAPQQVGTNLWMYKAGTTTQIGLTGTTATGFEFTSSFTVGSTPQPFQVGAVVAVNGSGLIAGTSNYYVINSISPAGTLAWIYSPSAAPGVATSTPAAFAPSASSISGGYGTYQMVGLADYSSTATSHALASGAAVSSITAMNGNGQATGFSNRYSSGGTAYGTDAWYYNGMAGAASVLITPSSSLPTFYSYYVAGTNTLNISSLNSNGMVAGTASRYKPGTFTGLGVVGWVYNPGDSKTFEMISFPDLVTTATGNSDRYFQSTIEYVADSGLVLGYYNTYAGTTNSGASANKIFAWYDDGSATGAFVTLGNILTDTNINDVNWSVLSGLITVGADGVLYGFGKELSPSSTQQAVFELTVPEPASLAMLGLGGVMLLARRRRAAGR